MEILATSANDIYIVPQHLVRSFGIENSDLIGITEGEEIRNWSAREPQLLVRPYDAQWNLAELQRRPKIREWLNHFKDVLGHRKDFGGGTYFETNRPWFEYHQLDLDKVKAKATIAFPDVVTHAHFLLFCDQRLFKDHSPVLLPSLHGDQVFLLLSLINSGAALFTFKQVCFNKGAGEDEHRDRFEYAGNKVQQLPVPEKVAEVLKGKHNALGNQLSALSSKLTPHQIPSSRNLLRARRSKIRVFGLLVPSIRSVSVLVRPVLCTHPTPSIPKKRVERNAEAHWFCGRSWDQMARRMAQK